MDLNNLKGLTIYVGRESNTNKLLMYSTINGKIKGLALGSDGCVPISVSRALPNENKAHVSISVDNSEMLTVTNLKAENVTFIDGLPILSKKVSKNDFIELGKDHFRVEIESILHSFNSIISKESKKEGKTYNISHLEKVWNDYKSGQKEIKENQKKINLVRSGCGIFTMCAMPTIFFLGPIGYVLTGIGVLGNVYSFWGMKKSDPQEEMEKLTDNFQENYVCPNPQCRRFLGNYKYSMMKNQYKMECPYCKSKFVDD